MGGELALKNNQIQDLEKSNKEAKTQLKKSQKFFAETLKNMEAKTNDHQLKSIEETNAKYQKLKQLLATKIFWYDTTNENLENLLTLDTEKLFEKYDQIMQAKTSNNIELEETIGTLNDVKTKLKLQIQQRELFEKQQSEIMDSLNIPTENRCFASILPAIRDLKEFSEQNETVRYANAESVLKSFTK